MVFLLSKKRENLRWTEISKPWIVNRFNQSLPFLIAETMSDMPLRTFSAVFAEALGGEYLAPTPE